MIRKFRESDLNEVAEIWLSTNIEAHDFISEKYWKDNFEPVKGMFLESELYVYEDEKTNKIQGFVGIVDDYIAGIFVDSKCQSCGIGKLLLDFIKGFKSQLNLKVYKKNVRAVEFYKKQSFEINGESVDEDTGEKEYIMSWNN